MWLVDASVVIYATNEDALQHRRRREWIESALRGAEPVGFARVVLLPFLRVATSSAILPAALTVAEATDQLTSWLTAPAALTVEPTSRQADVLAGLLIESGTAGNRVNDAHLAALAVEHAATIVTFDRDFGRFAGVRSRAPGG